MSKKIYILISILQFLFFIPIAWILMFACGGVEVCYPYISFYIAIPYIVINIFTFSRNLKEIEEYFKNNKKLVFSFYIIIFSVLIFSSGRNFPIVVIYFPPVLNLIIILINYAFKNKAK